MSRIPGEELGLQPEIETLNPEGADAQMGLFADQEIFAHAEVENVEPTDEEFQVAGPVTRDIGRFAQKKIIDPIREKIESTQPIGVPPLEGGEAVKQMGGYHIIREPTDEEVRAINTTLGVDLKTKPPAIDINFDRIIQADDEEAVMRELLDMSKAFVEQEKRGSQTFQQTIANVNLRLGGRVAQAYSLLREKTKIDAVGETTYVAKVNQPVDANDQPTPIKLDTIIETMLTRQKGTPISAEELISGRITLQLINNETTRLVKLVQSNQGDESTVKKMSQMIALEGAFMAKLLGGRAEAARTTAANRIIPELSENRFDSISRLLDEGGAESAQWLADRYMALPTQAARSRFSRGIVGKTVDVWQEVFLNSLLSAFSTDAVNIMSNLAFTALQVPERLLAGGVGAIRRSVTGDTTGVDAFEAIDLLHGYYAGLMDAAILAGRAMRTGEPQSSLTSKLDARTMKAITAENFGINPAGGMFSNLLAKAVDGIGTAVRIPGRFLMTEDEFFKAWNGTAQKHALARRMMRQNIRDGMSPDDAKAMYRAEILDPSRETVEGVRDFAETVTFTKDLDGFLGNVGVTMSHPLLKIFLPFYKTPTNIVIQAMSRTPLGLFSPEMKKLFQSGDKADFDVAVSRVAIGSAFMGAFAMAADTGSDSETIITGSGPQSRGSKAAWRRQKFQPYSICSRIDGTQTYDCVSYARFEPISALMAMAADYTDYSRYSNSTTELEQLTSALASAASNYTGQLPMVQGMTAITEVMGNKYDATTSRLVDAIDLVGKTLGQSTYGAVLSPAIMASIERMQDPRSSNTRPDPNLPMGVRGFYEALNKMKARNPFFSDDVPRRYNHWNEEIIAGNGNAFDLFSPIRVQKAEYNVVDNAMVEMSHFLGNQLVFNFKVIDGIKLTAEQENEFIKLFNETTIGGTTVLDDLKDLVTGGDYDDLSLEEKVQEIQDIVTMYRSEAKEQMGMQYLDLQEKIEFNNLPYEERQARKALGAAP